MKTYIIPLITLLIGFAAGYYVGHPRPLWYDAGYDGYDAGFAGPEGVPGELNGKKGRFFDYIEAPGKAYIFEARAQ